MEEGGQVFDKFLLSPAGGFPTLGLSKSQSKSGLSLLYSQRVANPERLVQEDERLAIKRERLSPGHVFPERMTRSEGLDRQEAGFPRSLSPPLRLFEAG